MAYASLIHVAAANAARPTYTATSKPSATHADILLRQVEGELDLALLAAGYTLPVPTTATSALKLLEHAAAVGACWRIELSAPAQNNALMEEYQQMFERAKAMIESGELDIAKDATALPRSLFPASPIFSRDMDL